MYKFAHLADCHIGAQKYPELKELEMNAFKKCMDRCMVEKVDFIVISGDLFHSNLPNMGAVKEAVEKMKEVRDQGIPIYLNYGSHDYSPNETSIIDLLNSAGLIQKIVEGEVKDEKLKLKFFQDPATGAKLCGISARKMGLESSYYDALDRESLQNEPGFKIFVFHSAITDFKPEFLAEMDSIPLSLFPRGFNYYAGGHVHLHSEHHPEGYGSLTYPGPLFGSYSKDMEISARGEERGFYLVNFQDEVKEIEFIPLPVCKYEYMYQDAYGKNAIQVQNDLMDRFEKIDVEKKVVLLKIRGELSGGKTSNIDSRTIKDILTRKGALYVGINRHGLTSREQVKVKITESDIPSIEKRLFTDRVGDLNISEAKLQKNNGIKLAVELLRTLREEQKLNEKKKDYEERMKNVAIHTLHLEEVFYEN
ncbi:MAG: exonuclease SbcCD subunit D [Methanobacteriaceae archaeon]|nr:exonuclease SbcCD subunit D [Methanobacteriaceae archaeon]